jgi:hypothetical protein
MLAHLAANVQTDQSGASAFVGPTVGGGRARVPTLATVPRFEPCRALRYPTTARPDDVLAPPCARPAPAAAPGGRGMALIGALCANVEYRGCGHEVRVAYTLSAPHAERLRRMA